VQPELIVALGATAARSVMGRPVTIGKLRGEALSLDDGARVVITIHPSALLRMREEAEKRAAYAAFVKDLKVAAKAVFGKKKAA
jgi:uracil-DNA glycosylase